MLETSLILTGVALIAGAIIGGGVKLLQVEFKEIPSLWRQLLLGLFGIILVGGGLEAGGHLNLPRSPSGNQSTSAPSGTLTEANSTAAQTVANPAAQPPAKIAPSNDVEATLTTVMTPAKLQSALRLRIGDATGASVSGAEVRQIKIWLDLPEAERQLIQSVRYEFYDPTFRSPKYPARGSPTFAATWLGYGCIRDAAVIAQTIAGEVKAPFDLCTLWDQGHL